MIFLPFLTSNHFSTPFSINLILNKVIIPHMFFVFSDFVVLLRYLILCRYLVAAFYLFANDLDDQSIFCPANIINQIIIVNML